MIGEYSVGPAVLVPARIALLLVRELKVNDVRVAVRGIDRELDAVLASWLEVAALEQHRLLNGSVPGTPLRDSVPGTASSASMTTAQVAKVSGLTERGIRKAVDRGRLHATRLGHALAFDPGDVALWLAGRER